MHGKNTKTFQKIEFSQQEFEKFQENELVRALILLLQIKEKKLSRIFAMHLVTQASNTKDILMLSKILNDFNKISLSIFVGKKAIYNNTVSYTHLTLPTILLV